MLMTAMLTMTVLMVPWRWYTYHMCVVCGVQMSYAELLWLDRLGMYIRSEVAGQEPTIVRVPFYR